MKKVAILLTGVCLFCLLTLRTAALALPWQQHKTAEERVGFFVFLRKLERNADGNPTDIPLSGAEFTLYDQSGAAIGPYVSDSNGLIALCLNPGRYCFAETKPAPGYTYDWTDGQRVSRYFFEITGEEDAGQPLLLLVYNRKDDFTAVPSEPPATTTPPVEPLDPTETGDKSAVILWVVLICFSAAGLLALTVNLDKQKVSSRGKRQDGR